MIGARSMRRALLTLALLLVALTTPSCITMAVWDGVGGRYAEEARHAEFEMLQVAAPLGDEAAERALVLFVEARHASGAVATGQRDRIGNRCWFTLVDEHQGEDLLALLDDPAFEVTELEWTFYAEVPEGGPLDARVTAVARLRERPVVVGVGDGDADPPRAFGELSTTIRAALGDVVHAPWHSLLRPAADRGTTTVLDVWNAIDGTPAADAALAEATDLTPFDLLLAVATDDAVHRLRVDARTAAQLARLRWSIGGDDVEWRLDAGFAATPSLRPPVPSDLLRGRPRRDAPATAEAPFAFDFTPSGPTLATPPPARRPLLDLRPLQNLPPSRVTVVTQELVLVEDASFFGVVRRIVMTPFAAVADIAGGILVAGIAALVNDDDDEQRHWHRRNTRRRR